MERRDTTINGRQYSLLLPPPLQALPICNRVGVLIAPLLTRVSDKFADGTITLQDMKESSQKVLGSFLGTLTQAVHELDAPQLTSLFIDAAFASKLTCNGELINTGGLFDRHFTEHREDTYPVLIWCLWECVIDFFPQAKTFIQATKTGAQEYQSQKTG